MKIALFSRKRNGKEKEFVDQVIRILRDNHCDLLLHENCINDTTCQYDSFASHLQLSKYAHIDFLISLGGDGTFIDAANLTGKLNIPIIGVNTGRIGFLTGVNKNNFEQCFSLLLKGQYTIENRSLLHLESTRELTLSSNFALNDITVRTSDENSINSIKVWVNNQLVNTYWADGLIIATPTGSTAYSLSCGGPIIVPSTNVHILTPIASHTLAVRPIVISADDVIKIVVESRNGTFSLAVDSERVVVNNPVELTISKECFSIPTVLFQPTNYYHIIREKLLWGIDKRNGEVDF